MNKPRLIDANELIRLIEYWYESCSPRTDLRDIVICDTLDSVLQHIDDIPTAYDINEVVDQLNNCANKEVHLWASDEDDYDESGKLIIRKITDLHRYGAECYDKAIEIVKGGAK